MAKILEILCTGKNCPLKKNCVRHIFFEADFRIKGVKIINPPVSNYNDSFYCEQYYSDLTKDTLTQYPFIVHEN